MDKLVVDSSVWIDFFNKKTSPQIEKIKEFILADFTESRILILPVILQEVLQGIQDDKAYSIIKETIQGFNYPQFEIYHTAIKAADLFRFLRKKGITIRKANDCLIAAICIEMDLKLMHNDKDFDNIAKYTSLKIYK